jgi:hypothetical protein
MKRINVRIDRVVGNVQFARAGGPAAVAEALARAIRDGLATPLPAEQGEDRPLDPDRVVATVERAVRTSFGRAVTRP